MRVCAASIVLNLYASQSCSATDGLPSCSQHELSRHCVCDIASLRPTQVSVGYLHVQDILKNDSSKLQQRAVEKPIEVVIGPDHDLYVTDGHHHANAMLAQSRRQLGPSTTICRIISDDSNVPSPDRHSFLKWLADRHQARLNGGDDVDGEARPGLYPPETLDAMTDDSYRSLVSFMEDGCGFKIEGDYGEFPLADLLRHAQVHPPTELAHKKDQGRQAALALVTSLNTETLQREFQAIPHHGDIAACASQRP